jgi:hypothetical protein
VPFRRGLRGGYRSSTHSIRPCGPKSHALAPATLAQSVFALSECVTTLAAPTLLPKRRTLEWQLAGILSSASSGDLTRALQGKTSPAYDPFTGQGNQRFL